MRRGSRGKYLAGGGSAASNQGAEGVVSAEGGRIHALKAVGWSMGRGVLYPSPAD